MATKKTAAKKTAVRTTAAKKNIHKAQAAWKQKSSRQRALAQPEGRQRAKPGTKATGDYFRIVVRPKSQFVTFRTQDVGGPGHIQRLAGKRESGSWATQSWLISKEDAHISGDRLIADSRDAKDLLKKLGAAPIHVKGDVFEAKDRPNVPEARKPTRAQQTARRTNIRKAQQARAGGSRAGTRSATKRGSTRTGSRSRPSS